MPIDGSAGPQQIQRQICVVRGVLTIDVLCAPRFDYARTSHRLSEGVFQSDGAGPVLRLSASVPLAEDDGGLRASIDLAAGQSPSFILEIGPDFKQSVSSEESLHNIFHETINWWRRWTGQSLYVVRWRETVGRSALVLKMLTSHGAPVPSATFGLPELFGGDRNWDYRYVWLRDAACTMYALVRLGLTHEAGKFVDWIAERVRNCEGMRWRRDFGQGDKLVPLE